MQIQTLSKPAAFFFPFCPCSVRSALQMVMVWNSLSVLHLNIWMLELTFNVSLAAHILCNHSMYFLRFLLPYGSGLQKVSYKVSVFTRELPGVLPVTLWRVIIIVKIKRVITDMYTDIHEWVNLNYYSVFTQAICYTYQRCTAIPFVPLYCCFAVYMTYHTSLWEI